MGAKATFDPVTRIIKLTEAPTLVNGEPVVNLDVQVDLYSDWKEDWITTPALRRVRPPITGIGGQTTPTGRAGNTWFQRSDWSIEPYDADHRLIVDGNLYRVDGTSPFIKPSGGTYQVEIERFISNIVDTVEINSGSGLNGAQNNMLVSVFNNLDSIEGAMSHKSMMRTFMSVLCGEARDADTLGPITENTTRVEFLDMSGQKRRVVADSPGFGTRQNVALDAS